MVSFPRKDLRQIVGIAFVVSAIVGKLPVRHRGRLQPAYMVAGYRGEKSPYRRIVR